jgi:acyl dehydratase
MEGTESAGVVTDMEGLRAIAPGTHLGYSDWQQLDQDVVNQFADATGDHQWIHVDVERAKASPFGGTIAHGYLTLSLVAPVTQQLLQVTDAIAGINYGLDRVRFPAPLPVGARWRGGAELAEISEIQGGVQVKFIATIEVDGSPKPACVAECLARILS